MTLACLLAGCLCAGPTDLTPAPPVWSPDGQWLLYLAATRPMATYLPPGWLFDADAAPASDVAPAAYRLWTTHLASGSSVLLATSGEPLSSSAWRPDGSAVVYVRLTPGPNRALELVVQRDPARADVVYQRKLQGAVSAGWGGSPVSLSPDGQIVAFAEPDRRALSFVRLETGRLLRTIDDATCAIWSPNGEQVAILRGGAQPGVYLVDALIGEPHRLIELPNAERLPPPLWDRDGRSVQVVRLPRPRTGLARRGEPALELLRVPCDGGNALPQQRLVLQPMMGPDAAISVSITQDAEGEQLFYVTNIADQVSQVTWSQGRLGVIRKRFNPSDDSLRLGSLQLGPDGKQLALRVGGEGADAPVAIVDPDSEVLQPLIPDQPVRFAWLDLLAGAQRSALEVNREAGEKVRPPIRGRPSLLPSPIELGRESPFAARFGRLGRLGCRLLAEHVPGENPEGPEAVRLAEARLLFHYLRTDDRNEHLAESARLLERVEAATDDRHERERLACLRVQIDLAQGELDRARATIECLRESRRPATAQLEETGQSVVLTPVDPDPIEVWLSLLDHAAEQRPAGAAIEGVAAPPEPGLMEDLPAHPPAELHLTPF